MGSGPLLKVTWNPASDGVDNTVTFKSGPDPILKVENLLCRIDDDSTNGYLVQQLKISQSWHSAQQPLLTPAAKEEMAKVPASSEMTLELIPSSVHFLGSGEQPDVGLPGLTQNLSQEPDPIFVRTSESRTKLAERHRFVLKEVWDRLLHGEVRRQRDPRTGCGITHSVHHRTS